jgi:hypothetical protein
VWVKLAARRHFGIPRIYSRNSCGPKCNSLLVQQKVTRPLVTSMERTRRYESSQRRSGEGFRPVVEMATSSVPCLPITRRKQDLSLPLQEEEDEAKTLYIKSRRCFFLDDDLARGLSYSQRDRQDRFNSTLDYSATGLYVGVEVLAQFRAHRSIEILYSRLQNRSYIWRSPLRRSCIPCILITRRSHRISPIPRAFTVSGRIKLAQQRLSQPRGMLS